MVAHFDGKPSEARRFLDRRALMAQDPNMPRWDSWVLDKLLEITARDLRFPRVVDYGAGTGGHWAAIKERIPSTWNITLVEESPELLREASRDLSALPVSFTFECGDRVFLEKLPRRNVEVFLALHALNRSPDPHPVLHAIRDAIRTDGVFFASLPDINGLKELHALLKQFNKDATLHSPFVLNFPILGKHGPRILDEYFNSVRAHTFVHQLDVRDPEVILRYVRACDGEASRILQEPIRAQEFTELLIEAARTRGGHIDLTTQSHLYICRP